jgi:hypothetical protein
LAWFSGVWIEVFNLAFVSSSLMFIISNLTFQVSWNYFFFIFFLHPGTTVNHDSVSFFPHQSPIWFIYLNLVVVHVRFDFYKFIEIFCFLFSIFIAGNEFTWYICFRVVIIYFLCCTWLGYNHNNQNHISYNHTTKNLLFAHFMLCNFDSIMLFNT